MATDHYDFVTNWTIPAPVDRVWHELMTPEHWPEWWRGVEHVRLIRPGTQNGVGAVREYVFRSRLPYRLSFSMETVRIEPQRVIEGRASGELAGVGRWQLEPAGPATAVRYDWQVRTTKAWMRWLAPIARPVFAWNHDVIMEWGRAGLVQRIAQRPPHP